MGLFLLKCEVGGGGGELPVRTRYTCAPPVIGKIKKILSLVIGKNRKNLDILPLNRVKFEISAWVIAQMQEN